MNSSKYVTLSKTKQMLESTLSMKTQIKGIPFLFITMQILEKDPPEPEQSIDRLR